MWVKKGLLFVPDGENPLMRTHAAVPTPVPLEGDVYRVYFSSRDSNNIGRIFYMDVEIDRDEIKVIWVNPEPVLDVGELGTFDEHGVMPSYVLKKRDELWLYYIGWQRLKSVPFNTSIGLAISHDGKVFKRTSRVPLIDRNDFEPFLIASPFVLEENGIYRMWHIGGVKWEKKGDILKHYYNIRYAYSSDGLNWIRTGKICIDFVYEGEYAIARPVVLKDGNIYKMWYSFRASPFGETYRIGYAESEDGINWVRKDDEVGIDVSDEGWDSEMICYAYVFDHKGVRFMLYNGNGYGKTGIGYAVYAG